MHNSNHGGNKDAASLTSGSGSCFNFVIMALISLFFRLGFLLSVVRVRRRILGTLSFNNYKIIF